MSNYQKAQTVLENARKSGIAKQNEKMIQDRLGDSYGCFLCDIRPETKQSKYLCSTCARIENE